MTLTYAKEKAHDINGRKTLHNSCSRTNDRTDGVAQRVAFMIA
jgi:hypothetical protein